MYPIQQINPTLLDLQTIGTGTVTSIEQDVSSCVRLCVQAVWTGTSPIGVLSVLVSNDGINFDEDPEVTPINISGNSGSALVKIANCSYPWLQLSYVGASGTGTLTVTVSGKNS
jgi:hypothetical protein